MVRFEGKENTSVAPTHKTYDLRELIETGVRVAANPLGRVIGYAKLEQEDISTW